MPALTPDEAKVELDRRWQTSISGVTPEAIASGKHGERHQTQIDILNSQAQNLIFMCSRRSGKSEVCCGLLLMTAVKTPDVSCLYLALTADAAELIFRKWKKLLRRLRVPNTTSDSSQYTEFPNGSRVLFTGTDDTRRVTHLLGDQMAGGIAIIDEAQSDPGIMETTVEDVLAPCLDETTHDKPTPGRLVLSGTVPDVPAGYFWTTWTNNRNDDDTATKPGSLWQTFAWSRYDNPFQLNNAQREEEYRKKYNLTAEDPEVQRRWHGKRVFARFATAYRFDPRAHTYSPSSVEVVQIGPFKCTFAALPEGCDRFIVGIDQAQRRDRFTFVGWTWNHVLKNNLWQFMEAGTEPGGDPQESEWLAIAATTRTRYPDGSMEFCRDAGGSSAPVNDALRFSHGIMINSAIKTPGSLKARVQRLSDLLAIGVAKVIEGGQLADDLTTAKWSIKARESGKWEFDKSARSPDYCDAAGYPLDLPSYTQIGGLKPPEPRLTQREWLEREQKKTLDDMLRGKAPKPPAMPLFAKLWLPPK